MIFKRIWGDITRGGYGRIVQEDDMRGYYKRRIWEDITRGGYERILPEEDMGGYYKRMI